MATRTHVLIVMLLAQLAFGGAQKCRKETWGSIDSPTDTGVEDVFNSYNWRKAQGSVYGRQTTYEAVQGHVGWCGPDYVLRDDPSAVPVAIDDDYLPEGKSPYHQQPYTGNCGRYMCVRIISNDRFCVEGETAISIANTYSNGNKMTTFLAQVKDKCPECESNHIDIAFMKPYSNKVSWNDAKNVGVWWVEWAFVPGKVDCDFFFKFGLASQQAANRRPGPKRPVSAPTSRPVSSCKVRMNKGQQCGGFTGRAGKNVNSLWPNYCCAAGSGCKRVNDKYWQCK